MGIQQEVQRLAAANVAKEQARLALERAQDAVRLAKEEQENARRALEAEIGRMVEAAEKR